jgi:hypothetical protein
MGFYSAVWSVIDQPLAGFQIGLAGDWILPYYTDIKDKPPGIFQTIEGGIGYWSGNHFRYGPPKFSMNGTPHGYEYEIGSPVGRSSTATKRCRTIASVSPN